MKTTDRRSVLKAGLGGLAGLATVPVVAGLAGCQTLSSGSSASGASSQVSGASGAKPAKLGPLTTEKLSERVTLIVGAPGNVIALAADGGVVLVDSGAAEAT